MNKPIYLDFAASCPIHPKILDVLKDSFENNFGNAGSELHYYGWKSEEIIEKSRLTIQQYFKNPKAKIIFTSGATESNNLAIQGYLNNFPNKGHIISSKIEHKAVLEIFYALEKKGWEITLLSPDSKGILDLNELTSSIKSNTKLISLMWVNNELGTINPISEIHKIAQDNSICFHSDFTQGIGKLPIEFPLPDMITFSGHKLYSPKGIGGLMISNNFELKPLNYGGGQEYGFRPGTLPSPLIEALGNSFQLIPELLNKIPEYEFWNNEIRRSLKESFGERIQINSHEAVPQILNFTIKDIDWEKLFLKLNKLAISNGSACNFKTKNPSHVGMAIGLSENNALSTIRISFGEMTNQLEIDFIKEYLISNIKELLHEGMD